MKNLSDFEDFVDTLYDKLNKINTEKIPNRDHKDLLHWSSILYNSCHRYFSLVKLFPDECQDAVKCSSTKITFDIGRHVEEKEREKLIRIFKKGILALWSCPCEETQVRSIDPPGKECVHCGNPIDRYNEFVLPLTKFNVNGSPDFLLCKDNTIIVFEIKSKADSLFTQLQETNEADAIHKLQAGSYVHFLNYYLKDTSFKDLKVSPYYIIYYVNKKNKPYKNPYHFYIGNANSPFVKEEMKNGIKFAQDVTEQRKSKIIPERKCINKAEGKKIKCPAVEQCFKTS